MPHDRDPGPGRSNWEPAWRKPASKPDTPPPGDPFAPITPTREAIDRTAPEPMREPAPELPPVRYVPNPSPWARLGKLLYGWFSKPWSG